MDTRGAREQDPRIIVETVGGGFKVLSRRFSR